MASQRFIAKKVGDRYITVPASMDSVCTAWTATGGLVLGVGLLKRGFTGCATMLVGAGMIYRGMTGNNPLQSFFGGGSMSPLQETTGPSFQHDFHTKPEQKPEDEVDEASMESFPASDAPARSLKATTDVSA